MQAWQIGHGLTTGGGMKEVGASSALGRASAWPMLIWLSAMTPKPPRRWMPGRPL